MAHAEAKKRRCVLAVKNRAKGHSLSKAFRLISDLENISVKTISFWWYAQAAKEKSKPSEGHVEESEKVEMVDRPFSNRPAVPPPEPVAPYVDMDSGIPRCSRCSTSNDLERNETGFFCHICRINLPWSAEPDVEIKYRDSAYRIMHWMA